MPSDEGPHRVSPVPRRMSVGIAVALALGGAALAVEPVPERLHAMLNAPLGSADPSRPVDIIASGVWVFSERASAETQARIDPRQKLRVNAPFELGSFKVDGSKGPVTLVVDFGALRAGMTGGQGTVGIGIECVERPGGCAVPLGKTMLIFSGDRMGRVALRDGQGSLPLLMGRGAHRYEFQNGEQVRVQLEVKPARDFEPLLVKAWLIYGTHAVEVVPGQTSRKSTVITILAAGAALLAVLMWRLMRRR